MAGAAFCKMSDVTDKLEASTGAENVNDNVPAVRSSPNEFNVGAVESLVTTAAAKAAELRIATF